MYFRLGPWEFSWRRSLQSNASRPGDAPIAAVVFAGFFVVLALVAGLTAYHGPRGRRATEQSLASKIDDAHDPLAEMDFFRIAFLSPETPVEQLGGPKASRVFFGESNFFLPPMTLSEMARYPGLTASGEKLVAIRCKPGDISAVQPVLATWPNVFQLIDSDLKSENFTCPAKTETDPKNKEKETANKVFCAAQPFKDASEANATLGLADMMKAAADVYAAADFTADDRKQNWLQIHYGIFPAFSGLGLSVKDSSNLDQQNMSSAVILRNSVSPEYLLKNTKLQDAGCRCITVNFYPGRSHDRIDPDFVWQRGGEGSCREVERLGVADRVR